jgi:hypothetical protein
MLQLADVPFDRIGRQTRRWQGAGDSGSGAIIRFDGSLEKLLLWLPLNHSKPDLFPYIDFWILDSHKRRFLSLHIYII